MATALLTDLYELNMAASYHRRGMVGPAVFSLFVRKLPPRRGFLVAAGLEECLGFLETIRFEAEDLEYLATIGFDDVDLAAFADLRFTGDVRAVPEGRLVFAGEPLLEVTAPIAEAQLVETYLLNQVTFRTALATKAARCRIAAGDAIQLVDFSFRRTHGIEAGLAVARLSAMVGFAATSNVEAARRYGLRPAGTMAHSYVEAFPTEIEAFRAFAEDRPRSTTFLVDTYDTLGGVQAAIDLIHELRDRLPGPLAVRLDSGDLTELARRTRRLLDDAGLPEVRIFASGGLDEFDVERFVTDGAPVDALGVGTRLGVSADAPSLDSVYKLVAYGDRPVMKLSEGKTTWPGAKQVYRLPTRQGDVIALRDERPPGGGEALLRTVMRGGQRVGAPDSLEDARGRFEADLADLPSAALDLHDPEPPAVRYSEALQRLATRLRGELSTTGAPTEVPSATAGRRR